MPDMAFTAADAGQKIRLFCTECKKELAYGNIDATPIIGHPDYANGCSETGNRWTIADFSLSTYPPA